MKNSKRILGILLAAAMLLAAMAFTVSAETATYVVGEHLDSFKTQGRRQVIGTGLTMDDTGSGVIFRADCAGKVTMDISCKRFTTSSFLFLTIYVDGQKQESQQQIPSGKTTTVTLADNLKAGEHTFEVYRATESRYFTAIAEAVSLDGTLLPPPEQSDLYIEFYGDSITAGFGVDNNASQANTANDEDGTRAYAFMMARELGADYSILAMSGHGVICGYGDNAVVSKAIPFYSFYRNSNAGDPNAFYTFPRQADIVVINLGTNDNNTMGSRGITDEQLKAAAVELVGNMLMQHPKSKLVWAYGAMGSGKSNIFKEVLEEMGGEDNGLFYVALPYCSGGTYSHPDADEQVEICKTLTSALKTKVMPSMTDVKAVSDMAARMVAIGGKSLSSLSAVNVAALTETFAQIKAKMATTDRYKPSCILDIARKEEETIRILRTAAQLDVDVKNAELKTALESMAVFKMGDLIGTDGQVDTADLVRLAKYVAGVANSDLDMDAFEAADFDGSRVVDVADLVSLARIVAGIVA